MKLKLEHCFSLVLFKETLTILCFYNIFKVAKNNEPVILNKCNAAMCYWFIMYSAHFIYSILILLGKVLARLIFTHQVNESPMTDSGLSTFIHDSEKLSCVNTCKCKYQHLHLNFKHFPWIFDNLHFYHRHTIYVLKSVGVTTPFQRASCLKLIFK